MKASFLSILFFVMFIAFCDVLAQDSSGVEVERQLEEAFEELDLEESGVSGEQLNQFLADLAENPVNINSAKSDDLLQIPGFNLILVRAVLVYRKNKPFESVEELLQVKGIGSVSFQRMRPYVTVGGSSERLRSMYNRPEYWLTGKGYEVISRYQQELEEQEGYKRPDSLGGYLGSPAKYYQRFRLKSDHLSMNFTQEKDAGERADGLTGFDYNSWHLALSKNGNLKELVVGDYSLNFGQGMVLWTGGSFGKGREVTGTISKNERGIRPYSSAQETDFFRGIGATYGEQIELSVFYSKHPRTAAEVNKDTTRFPSSSGFHRTETELERRNNIDQTVLGGRLKVDTPLGLIGVTGYSTQFSTYIAKGTGLSDLYDFEGDQNSVFGLDYHGLIGNALVFGEVARSQNGGMAGIAGVEAPLGFSTDLALLYRNYQKDFQSFMGTGFGESSGDPQNEQGFYIGLKHSLNKRYIISGYVDQYIFPGPRSGTTQRTGGFDVLGMLEAEFSGGFKAYVLLRNEIKDDEFVVNNSSGRQERILGKQKRSSIRLQTEYQLNRNIRLRSRGEIVKNQNAGEDWESGFLIFQDLRFRIVPQLQIDARLTIFDTDSFDTRIYQFENDLLYVLSNKALSDRGERAYLVAKFEATEYLSIWLKYSVSIYEDTQQISSGLGEIEGNRRSYLGVQARFYFR